jgi:T-complex protein 1 subunit theta
LGGPYTQVVVSGSSFGEMAMHFIERYELMAIKLPSKFELRRFCRATNSTGVIKLGRPAADELGFASNIDVKAGTTHIHPPCH